MTVEGGILEEDGNNAYGVHANLWRWTPRVDGPAFNNFLESDEVPLSARDFLRSFTPRLLGQAADPAQSGRSTGLVIGKVQSGKTNSFLALSALASDNGFRLIVVLSGTKNILKNQTHRQIVTRLSSQNAWRALDFDPANPAELESRLRTAVSNFAPRTLVVTILKRTRASTARTPDTSGIDRLAEFIEQSDYRERLSNLPALIIDDEADEASLDARANDRLAGGNAGPTATFAAIDRLRALFSNHLFIQYTATPQANLLVELTDELSPDFCELLAPGIGYCGAAEFFPEPSRYYREIPAGDVALVSNRSATPPDSLRTAMTYFLISSAIEDVLAEREAPEYRTMLVHPERLKAQHDAAHRWVQNILTGMVDAVDGAEIDPNGPLANGLRADITDCIAELRRTMEVPDLDLLQLLPALRARVDLHKILLVNAERRLPEEIRWTDELTWIFVGGDVLQRGFAMQNLTVTWMARSAGQGQVDVLMQRGRWFGYRSRYLPYCRVWLPSDVHEDYYAVFADHEEALWRSLRSHLDAGKDMQSWSRVFWLDPNPNLRLCRISTRWFRLRRQNPWATQEWFPASDEAAKITAAANNSALVQGILGEVDEWQEPWLPNPANPFREHKYTLVPLARLAVFFETYEFFSDDVPDGAVVRDAISVMLERDADAQAILINMRPRATDYRRGQGEELPWIETLQAGRSRINTAFYPGDNEFRSGGTGLPNAPADLLTLQVHQPAIDRPATGEVFTAAGSYLQRGCPFVAVHLPTDARSYRRERSGQRRP
ncbi:MAG: hypothetical protein JWN87_3357 [Frankiales bacterium]|nr:hypothetical protein [Frankiales bacterium]